MFLLNECKAKNSGVFVQAAAPELGPEDAYGVWRIDDTDNSFSTQPFRIRYARQDVLLSLMISFNLSLRKYEVPLSLPLGEIGSPVTRARLSLGKGLINISYYLKFELMYAPMLENGSELQASLDACPASVHEFRIPPKALLGLHSYCPVHFDSFHAVLVDISIHITLLRAGIHAPSSKVPSNFHAVEDVAGENLDGSIQVFKALFAARDRLLEELQKLSKEINQTIDLTDFISKLNDTKLIHTSLQADVVTTDAQPSGQVSGEPQSGLEKANGIVELRSDRPLNSLSKDDLLNSFHLLGNQILYLWNTFLNFHRFVSYSIN
ncbi:hypothetical protein CK203_031098 [Vitis vinifera]|uniref:Protein FAM135B n=1 Tax=Vitis vinifera TaxID=29760 RepID=A0A438J0Q1_VITVI|nr:hypothetical protein CK203_031098 [Vitis vinifera]